MNLEPRPIGSPDADPEPARRNPPAAGHALVPGGDWTWGQVFGFGSAVGALAAFLVCGMAGCAREDSWHKAVEQEIRLRAEASEKSNQHLQSGYQHEKRVRELEEKLKAAGPTQTGQKGGAP